MADAWEAFDRVMAYEPSEVPIEYRTIYALGWYFSEVNNGGLHQLFFNTAGDAVPDAIDACERVGARDLGEVLAAAAALLGDPYPTDRQQRQVALAALSEPDLQTIEDLTNAYYDAEQGYDLGELLSRAL